MDLGLFLFVMQIQTGHYGHDPGPNVVHTDLVQHVLFSQSVYNLQMDKKHLLYS